MATNVHHFNLFKTSKLISNARNELGDTQILKTLSALNRVMNYHAGRESVDVRINNRIPVVPVEQFNGKMWVHVWGRDCDCVESEWVAEINVSGFKHYCDRMYENAEGPVNIRSITHADYANYKQVEPRDRILEAFEEGRNYYV